MEKRWILALTLCAIFFIIWTTFVAPPPPAEKPAEPGKALPGKEQPQQEAPPPPVRRDLEKKDVALTAVQKDVKLEENISFDAGLMSLVFTNRGASLKSVSLKKYKALDGENNLVLLREFERIDQPRDSLSLRDNENLLDCDRALYEITDRTDNKIAFELQYDNGLIIKKVFTLHPDEYVIGVDVTVSNVNKEKPLALDLSLLGAAGISTEESRITSSPPRDIRAVVRSPLPVNCAKEKSSRSPRRISSLRGLTTVISWRCLSPASRPISKGRALISSTTPITWKMP